MSLTGEERVVIYGGGGRGRGGGMEGLWMCHDKVYLISLKGYVIFLFPPPPLHWHSIGSQQFLLDTLLAMTDPSYFFLKTMRFLPLT